MKLHRDIWPPYQPLTEDELEDLAEREQTEYEDRADQARKGEDR
jgi:hypothetical protein